MARPTGGEDASGSRCDIRYLLGPVARRQRADRLRLPATHQEWNVQALKHRVPSDGLF
jgi:hypothetical protein